MIEQPVYTSAAATIAEIDGKTWYVGHSNPIKSAEVLQLARVYNQRRQSPLPLNIAVGIVEKAVKEGEEFNDWSSVNQTHRSTKLNLKTKDGAAETRVVDNQNIVIAVISVIKPEQALAAA